MNPTPEQLRELFVTGYRLTAQLKGFIRLIDMLPSGELCIVIQPRQFPNQRIIIYIEPNGSKKYV
jgi:hypothetical protein